MITKTPAGISAALWEMIISDLDPASSTVNDYRKVLNLLHSTGNGQYRIQSMTTEDAVEYFGYLDSRVENGDLSSNTAHRYKATLRSLGKRIEQSKAIDGYTSPFSGLMKNEKRLRTEYTEDMFVSADSINKIRKVIPGLPLRSRAILEMILYIGLSPIQIRNIRVCDFHKLDDGRLTLTVDAGTFLEPGVKLPEDSPLLQSGAPVEFVRSSTRGITWKYIGTFIFTKHLSDILSEHVAGLGINDDTRKFFMTARHHEYTYRALHHLIREVCTLAGIEENLTPNQLALTGIVSGWYLEQAHDPGYSAWERYPIPLQETMTHIQEQISEEFLESIAFYRQIKQTAQ